MEQNKKKVCDLSLFSNRIASTFTGKTILITGATGLVGKLLVERFLHSTDVKKIYILMRSKRGDDIQHRFASYFDNIVFDSLKFDRDATIFSKVEPIFGDVSQVSLGISQENRLKLIEEVDIVYHAAANVRFDGTLTRNVLINVRGTKFMLELAQEIKHLKLFVYISTTYLKSNEKMLPESAIEPPFNPHELITMVENTDESTLNVLTAKLLSHYNDTYVFSKCLAETLIYEQVNKLPVMIVRPSIIMPCVQTPIPGYIDNFYGPIGSWILTAKGVLHVIKIPGDNNLEYIPADMLINTLFLTSYNYIENTIRKVTICNATNFSESQRNWAKQLAENYVTPLDTPVWHYGTMFVTNPILFNITFICIQLLPSILLDVIFGLLGRQPIFVDIQRKIARIDVIVHKYARVKNWNFEQNHIQQLSIGLNPREQAAYPLNMDNVKVSKWIENMWLFWRRHLLHEKDKDLPGAIKMKKIMWVIHNVVKWLLFAFVFKFLYGTVLPLFLRIIIYFLFVCFKST